MEATFHAVEDLQLLTDMHLDKRVEEKRQIYLNFREEQF